MAFTANMSGTVAVADSVIQEFDQQFLIAAADEGIMEQFITYKKAMKGSSVSFPKYARLTPATTPLVELDDVTSEAMVDSPISITPAEYGNAVTKTELASLQTDGRIDRAAPRLVGLNMGRTQDILAALAAEASTNALTVDGGAESALTAADVMTAAFLNQLYNKLKRQGVMPLSDGMYVAVMHDDVAHDLRASVGSGSWSDISKFARPENVLRNQIGELSGFKIITDSNLTISADAGASLVDTYKTLCMGFNALGKASSLDPHGVLSGPFDKLGRFVNVGWKGVFNYKIVDQDALYVGITASSVGVNV